MSTVVMLHYLYVHRSICGTKLHEFSTNTLSTKAACLMAYTARPYLHPVMVQVHSWDDDSHFAWTLEPQHIGLLFHGTYTQHPHVYIYLVLGYYAHLLAKLH